MTHTIPYAPRTRVLLIFALMTLAIWVVSVIPWTGLALFEYCAYVLGVALLVITLCGFYWKRSVVIDYECITAPPRPLFLRPKRVVLRDIQRVWVVHLPLIDVLCVRSSDAQLEIHDWFLPDYNVFRELRLHLESFAPIAPR